MEEITRIIGGVFEKPDLKYVQFPYEEAEKAMQGMGLSKDVSALFIQMVRAINDGLFKPTEARSAKNTTSTPFEKFAQILTQVPVKTGKTSKRSATAGAKRR
jgi:hypothetical protein